MRTAALRTMTTAHVATWTTLSAWTRRARRAAADDRGEIASSVWLTVGMILLAVAVLAALTAFVRGQLARIPGTRA